MCARVELVAPCTQVRKLVRIRKSETHGLEGIIDDRLEFLMRGDQTARPDYAMLTAGGRVVGHSPVHRAQFPAARLWQQLTSGACTAAKAATRGALRCGVHPKADQWVLAPDLVQVI